MTRLRGFVLAVLLGVLACTALPTAAAAGSAGVEAVAGVETVSVVRAVAAEQVPAPPPGPVIDPSQSQQADGQQAKSKIVVGVAAAGLAIVVLWGRKIRGKRKKKTDAAAKGK